MCATGHWFSVGRFIVVVAQVVLFGSACAWCQPTYQPGDVNLEYSRVYVLVDRTNSLGHAHGVEGKLKAGKLETRDSKPGKLVFDMSSFDADTPLARQVFGMEGEIDAGTRNKVNANMKGKEVLDVDGFPEATLENVSLAATGAKSSRELPEYVLEGDFTLCHATRHIQARCEMEQQNGWQHLRGSFKIRQSDYGIQPFSRVLGAVGVQDELLIVGDLWSVPDP